eukprot:TRINITY_DN1060_c0_g1_i1.p1 TRINITY_DN1060_c0_g1~~TRINITY_DN1060_c0_g1_i1.p1  ORF type:complete len:325 (-),score=73.03 TRINITY_DN1060_c0_g1_i1:66-1040(-)
MDIFLNSITHFNEKNRYHFFSCLFMSSSFKTIENAHTDSIWGVGYSKLGYFVSCSADETIKIWMDNPPYPQAQIFDQHHLGVANMDISGDGRILACQGMSSELRIYDLEEFSFKFSVTSGPLDCWNVALSSQGNFLATGSHSGNAYIFDVSSQKLVNTIVNTSKDLDMNGILSLKYSPNDRLLALGKSNGVVSVVDVETNQQLYRLTNHRRRVRTLAFSPDSNYIFVGADTSQIHMYDIRDSNPLLKNHLCENVGWIMSLDVSLDGKYLCSGSSEGDLYVWDLHNMLTLPHQSHENCINSVKFANDNRIVIGTDDCILRIYSKP